MLKSALEIANERHEKYEELSAVTDQIMEHVHLLEEVWNAIQPRPAGPEPTPLRRAA